MRSIHGVAKPDSLACWQSRLPSESSGCMQGGLPPHPWDSRECFSILPVGWDIPIAQGLLGVWAGELCDVADCQVRSPSAQEAINVCQSNQILVSPRINRLGIFYFAAAKSVRGDPRLHSRQQVSARSAPWERMLTWRAKSPARWGRSKIAPLVFSLPGCRLHLLYICSLGAKKWPVGCRHVRAAP